MYKQCGVSLEASLRVLSWTRFCFHTVHTVLLFLGVPAHQRPPEESFQVEIDGSNTFCVCSPRSKLESDGNNLTLVCNQPAEAVGLKDEGQKCLLSLCFLQAVVLHEEQ